MARLPIWVALGGWMLVCAGPSAAQSAMMGYYCVGGPKAGAMCDPSRHDTDCAFCDEGSHKDLSCTGDVDCVPDGRCRGTCENVPSDPVGSASRYAFFRDDQLWVTSLTDSGMRGDWAESDATLRRFTATSIGSGTSFSDTPASEDIVSTRGRFRDAHSDRVLLAYKVHTASGLMFLVRSPNPGAEPTWQHDGEPGGPIPPYTFPVSSQSLRSPLSLAAGDLDRRAGSDGFYHDEAVIAFEGPQQSLLVRVLDYQRNPGDVAATQFSALGTLASWERDGEVIPGSLAVSVGDYDADGANEIAVAWQVLTDAGRVTRLRLAILRYINAETDTPHLMLVKLVPLPPDTETASDVRFAGLQMASGDFDGDLADDLAILHLADNDFTRGARIEVIALDTDFVPHRTGVFRPLSSGTPSDGQAATWRPQLVSGLFQYNPLLGFGIGRRQLAMLSRLDERTVNLDILLIFDQDPTHFGFEVMRREPYMDQPEPRGTCEHSGAECRSSGDCGSERCLGVANMSLTAGNFRGGDPTALQDVVPIWSLALAMSEPYIAVYRPDVGTAFVYEPLPSDVRQYLVQAYDRRGNSVYLGPPLFLTVDQLIKPELIVQEPPKHCDWSPAANGGQFVNVTRKSGLAVTMSDDTRTVYKSKTTTTSDWTIGGSITLRAKATAELGVDKIAEAKVTSQGKLKVSGSFSERNRDYETRSQSYELSIVSSTTQDDLVAGSFRTLFIWRYPVIGFALTDRNAEPLTKDGMPLHPFYEIVLPGHVGHIQPSGGLNFDWYQPPHENGYVLSYPPISLDGENPVQLTDLGVYSLPGDMVCSNGAKTCAGGTRQNMGCEIDGDCPESVCIGKRCLGDADCRPTALSNATCDPAPKRQPLLNVAYFIDGETQRIDLTIKESAGGGATRRTAGKLGEDADLKVTAYASGGELLEDVKVKTSVEIAINNRNSWSTLRESQHETTSSTGFTLSRSCDGARPCNTAARAYKAATAYYYTESGTQKVVHAVDVTSSSSGRAFWQRYAGRPDPALNLPQRIVITADDQGEVPRWNDTLSHQRIRGFFLLHADDPATPALHDAPFGRAVLDGDKVKFRVRVYNYSLDTAVQDVPVLFVALPVDAADQRIDLAHRLPLCTVGTTCPTVSLAPRDMRPVDFVWDTTGHGPAGGGSQLYRIFVVLDPDCKWDAALPCGGRVKEIHEWQDRYNFPPTVDGRPDGEEITDPFTGEREVLESGQNNQGFGEVVIYRRPAPAPGEGGGAPVLIEPPPVDLSMPARAIAVRAASGAIRDTDVSLPVGRSVMLRVRVDASGPTNRPVTVLLYDGDPENGAVLGSRTLLGVDDVNGSYAWFDWVPGEAGTKTLFARVLEHTDDLQPGNDMSLLDVTVVADASPPSNSPHEDDGCQVHRASGAASGWWLLLPALACLILRVAAPGSLTGRAARGAHGRSRFRMTGRQAGRCRDVPRTAPGAPRARRGRPGSGHARYPNMPGGTAGLYWATHRRQYEAR